jgi:DNA (cytosine-5)-methyltransferase 1
MMKGISLFSSAGIGEYYFKEIGIEIVAANELLEKRAKLYSYLYPESVMVQGDICDSKVKNSLKSYIKEDVKFLVATPPCQGLSSLGKNKMQSQFVNDERNYLIFEIFDLIDCFNFDYILIENVPKFLDMYFPFNGNHVSLMTILKSKYEKEYNIEAKTLDAKDFGVPQTRPRAVIKIYKKHLKWLWPETQNEIPLIESIGHLPSLEPGEFSDYPNHFAKPVSDRIFKALSYTPTGKSALTNPIHYPKKEDGTRIKGFHNTYKRMKWDQPAHARTTYNGSVSSHNNIHPGKPIEHGKYSDSRVLTLLETFIVSSLPEDIKFPNWASESLIRTVIGESVPPLFLKNICNGINYDI